MRKGEREGREEGKRDTGLGLRRGEPSRLVFGT